MFPYERVVAWSAGPIAILAGWAATQLTQHVAILGSLGLGQDKVAHAIVVGVTFAVGAGVTYAAHHKWLTNLPSWWMHQEGMTIAAQAPAKSVAELVANVPDPGTDIKAAPAHS